MVGLRWTALLAQQVFRSCFPYFCAMALDTALDLVSAIATLVVVVIMMLVLQTRHSGGLRFTAAQKVTVVVAAAVGLLATGLALLL